MIRGDIVLLGLGIFTACAPPQLLSSPASADPLRLAWQGQAEGTLLLTTYLDKENITVKRPMFLRGAKGAIIRLRS